MHYDTSPTIANSFNFVTLLQVQKIPITYVISEHQKGYQEFCFNGDQYLYVNTNNSKKPLLLILSGQYTEQDSIYS